MHSAVREAAGIGFTGSAYAQSFVLADARMDWRPGAEEVSLNFHADGLVVAAPLPHGRHRVVAIVDEAHRRPVAERVVAFTDRMTRMATVRRRPARAARNVALPVLSRVPALRTRLVREPAELDYR